MLEYYGMGWGSGEQKAQRLRAQGSRRSLEGRALAADDGVVPVASAIWQIRDNDTDTQIGRWDNGLGTLTIGDYDFRMDTSSGNIDRGQSADTWINGFHLMSWGVEETGTGIQNWSGTIRVRPAGGGSDHDTASGTLQAEATP